MLPRGIVGRSSVTLPRVGDDASQPRVLRLRAGDAQGPVLESGLGIDAARVQIPTRELVEHGEAILVEMSFGPLVDPILLHGLVRNIEGGEPSRPARVTIGFPPSEAARVQYVRSVQSGDREASTRRDRRVPADFEVRWRWRESRYASRVRDISRGGAFIASRWQPEVGSRLGIELLPLPEVALHVDAVVSWVRDGGNDPGFGVNFRIPDRATASRLTEVVRAQEAGR